MEQTSAVLIAPVWQNQLLYRGLPYSTPCQDILLGQDGQNHPMAVQENLPLAAWPISGNASGLSDGVVDLLQKY